MIWRLILLAVVAGSVLAGCSQQETMDPNAGKGEVKAGAGDTKTKPVPNDSGP